MALRRFAVDIGNKTAKLVEILQDGGYLDVGIWHTRGQSMNCLLEILQHIRSMGTGNKFRFALTGTAGKTLARELGIQAINEAQALATAFTKLHPDVRSVLEIGESTLKYMELKWDDRIQGLYPREVDPGDKCAASSGAFLEQMAERFDVGSIGQFVDMAMQAELPAELSGRCSVFTESDIVHLFQKGTQPDSLAAGIHISMVRMYIKSVLRNRTLKEKIAFIGGVSNNCCIVEFLKRELGVDIFVPEQNEIMAAIGAGMLASEDAVVDLNGLIRYIEDDLRKPFDYDPSDMLQYELSERLPTNLTGGLPRRIARAGLGVDIGSVSTKAALVTYDRDGREHVLASYYTRTEGYPLRAVKRVMAEIRKQIRNAGWQIDLIVAGTTGSGRYLTANFIGADLIKNEITAQASSISSEGQVTVIEIGGQDSKYTVVVNGVPVDFEMNKACAGGTGAFIDKMAKRLGISLEDFGDVALQGKRPPKLNTNCTVFTEANINYFLQQNVPVENLAAAACYAIAYNYLKNLGSGRSIVGKVVFQGAVALNKGVVAAFETVLGQKIIVPAYPQITGAIGVAKLSYFSKVRESSFRGFEEISDLECAPKVSTCRNCENRCQLNTFNIGGEKFVYGDRCGDFSDQRNKVVDKSIPDLFATWRELSERSSQYYLLPDDAPLVGIPRTGLTETYWPFFVAFFAKLGYRAVPSDFTNKSLVAKALKLSTSEPCLPFKLAFGHVANLVDKGVKIIFFPRFISAEKLSPGFSHAQTCPLWQGAPDAVGRILELEQKEIQYLTPSLHFIEGRKSVYNQMMEVGKALLGDEVSEGQIREAVDEAFSNLSLFRKRVQREGLEVLQMVLDKKLRAFVVAARPYILWDPFINMDIGRKIRGMGIVPIPQDFLPLTDVDITDRWWAIYSRQLQNKLAVASLVRRNPLLQTIVVTVFGCGPDSFGNPFFKDEVGRPCYIMEVDEHTADAGVVTRLEAFADASENAAPVKPKEIRAGDNILEKDSLKGKILWIPNVNGGARALAAAFRGQGIDARVLPRSPDKSLKAARKLVTENVCLPMLVTLEDVLYRIYHGEGFDPAREAFFQGNSNGPCRFGMYLPLQRRILDDLGFADVQLFSLGIKEDNFGIPFKILTWDGLVCSDLLFKMVLRTRPYEKHKGMSDQLFEEYMKELESLLESIIPRYRGFVGMLRGIPLVLCRRHLRKFEELLDRAQESFAAIERKEEGQRPIIVLVGEFFVRLHDGANEGIIRRLEELGLEVWLAPLTEFFGYANWIGGKLAGDRFRRGDHSWEVVKKWKGNLFNARISGRDEHVLFEATLPYLDGYYDIPPWDIVSEGRAYCHDDFGGEAICSLGKLVNAAKLGLAGGISIGPLGCLPGNFVTAQARLLRKEEDSKDFPILCLTYDGFPDLKREEALGNFAAMLIQRANIDRMKTEKSPVV